MGARRHLLDRDCDSLGKIKAEPSGGEDDHQGHQKEGQNVTVLHRVLQKTKVLVLLIGTGDLKRPLGDALRNIIVDYDHTLNPLTAVIDRHTAADDVAVAESLSPGNFQ